MGSTRMSRVWGSRGPSSWPLDEGIWCWGTELRPSQAWGLPLSACLFLVLPHKLWLSRCPGPAPDRGVSLLPAWRVGVLPCVPVWRGAFAHRLG